MSAGTDRKTRRLGAKAAVAGLALASTPAEAHDIHDDFSIAGKNVQVVDVSDIVTEGFNLESLARLNERLAERGVILSLENQRTFTAGAEQNPAIHSVAATIQNDHPFMMSDEGVCVVNYATPEFAEHVGISSDIADAHEVYGHCKESHTEYVEDLLVETFGDSLSTPENRTLHQAMHESYADMAGIAYNVAQGGDLVQLANEVLEFRNPTYSEEDIETAAIFGDELDPNCDMTRDDHCSSLFVETYVQKVKDGEVQTPPVGSTPEEISAFLDEAFEAVLADIRPEIEARIIQPEDAASLEQ